ncbi:MAG: family 65 glycosyl hydrolase [Flavobacteriales bacterium MED-G15]|nr:MAG: family 65 glycosyl hydrolase [Flavobacteriales bacterium MED-G15]|tara:strand:+ start:782 stop:3094 length:2313 start_codon:yes stop_codon:yes gene_type:complete
MNQSYIHKDEWRILEMGFDPDNVKSSESIFSIGNGAMGQRANFEEQYSGSTFQGSYIGGVYYPDRTRVGWWKNGYPEYFAKVLNAPNWIGIDIDVEGEPLDLFAAKQVLDFTRSLNMKNGIYTRTFDVELANGIIVRVEAHRFLSMDENEIGAIEYNIELLSDQAKVKVSPYINGQVKNQDSNWDDPFWKHLGGESDVKSAFLRSKTNKTNFNICTYMSADLYLNGEEVSTGVEPFSKGFKLGYKAEIELVKGDKLTLTKYGGYTVSLNHPEEELEQVAMEKINYARARGFQGLLKEQEEVWHAIWKMSDIVIKGDLSAQQGIRFNIFQLNQTYTGSDSRLNIGPKGFTGEKYGGSAYWDTEAYCLPFFMVTKNANVAKNLLKYRYNQLPKAIENAEKLGFNNGAALFPMVTMNGEECHNEWEITFEEIHRNGAIAYAIYNYVRFTNDQTYIPEMGFEVLLAIARFWKQRVNYSSQKEKYVILGVTGPNEYENNVDNNWYTNYIAHWCLRYAAEQYNIIKAQHPKEFEEIFIKTNITDQEVMEWLTIAKNMYLPFSEKHQVYLQQDGFLDKELTTVDELNPNHRPINQHWSWDRILRSPFIKQADTLQGFYFFEDDFTIEELERHYDFYTPFTLHESSLSPCVHSILATKLDKMNDAYDLYLRTSRLDLDDYNKEVEEGLHITSMSGTWMSIVYGFGGLKIVDDLLSIEPKLPKQWEGISFKINFRGELLKIDYYKENCVFEWSGEKPLKMLLRNQPITVNPSSKVNIAI